MLNPEQPLPRRIRSFIRRQGRLTDGQQFALDNYWQAYGLEAENICDFTGVFGRNAPVCLEIGFGNGEALAQMAQANPMVDYLGIEVHRPGVGHLLRVLAQRGLPNVRVYCHDAVDILERCIPDGSLSAVHLFFPDPWPKKKHFKRRIVRAEFVELMARKLAPGGYFHAATDWQHYALSMMKVLSAHQGLVNASATGGFCERPAYRPQTKFERRGLKLGHGVWDLVFIKPG
ncbi:MAG: tRNA (guanosine(46)-N7)-methyltransferase TrmB [Methylobacter sp.]|nr:MAG: tRNA (guanosine(46)-N7)-methyltransferase TrmB [Methylobacter sp.]